MFIIEKFFSHATTKSHDKYFEYLNDREKFLCIINLEGKKLLVHFLIFVPSNSLTGQPYLIMCVMCVGDCFCSTTFPEVCVMLYSNQSFYQ